MLKAIEAALVSAFKKDSWGDGVNFSVKLNPNTGDIKACTLKTVVEEVEDDKTEISLKKALRMSKTAVSWPGDGDGIPLPSGQPHCCADC